MNSITIIKRLNQELYSQVNTTAPVKKHQHEGQPSKDKNRIFNKMDQTGRFQLSNTQQEILSQWDFLLK